MQTINSEQVSAVSGGNPILGAVALGIGSSYLYESMGGKAGIDNYFANSWASASSSVKYWQRRFQRAWP